VKTKLSPEPPDDERMDMTPEEMAQLNHELQKFGRALYYQPPSPMPEEIDTANPTLPTEESMTGIPAEPTDPEPQPDRVLEAQNVFVLTNKVAKAKADDPSYASTLGLRLGDFVAATWRGAYGADAKPPKEVVGSAIAVYIAQHRGEGMG
jgi:hypothetical protein